MDGVDRRDWGSYFCGVQESVGRLGRGVSGSVERVRRVFSDQGELSRDDVYRVRECRSYGCKHDEPRVLESIGRFEAYR